MSNLHLTLAEICKLLLGSSYQAIFGLQRVLRLLPQRDLKQPSLQSDPAENNTRKRRAKKNQQVRHYLEIKLYLATIRAQLTRYAITLDN